MQDSTTPQIDTVDNRYLVFLSTCVYVYVYVYIYIQYIDIDIDQTDYIAT